MSREFARNNSEKACGARRDPCQSHLFRTVCYVWLISEISKISFGGPRNGVN
jgi:hypothetical protein